MPLLFSEQASRHYYHHPRKLKTWLAALPMADTPSAARQIINYLKMTDAASMAGSELLVILETLRPTCSELAKRLHGRFQGVCPPLSEKYRCSYELATALEHRLAQLYESVFRAEDGVTSTAELTLAVQRFMVHQGREIIYHYGIYQQIPEKRWYQLHQAFQWAENRGLHNLPVADNTLTLTDDITVAGAYFQVLCCAIADPYCFLQGEAHKLYTVLELWCKHVSLQDYHPVVIAGRFTVDPFKDVDHICRHDKIHELRARSLDCRQLLKAVEHCILSGRFDITPATGDAQPHARISLAEHLLHKLLAVWGGGRRRRFSRSQCSDDSPMSIGLEEICRQLNGDLEAPWFQQSATLSLEPGGRPGPLGLSDEPPQQWQPEPPQVSGRRDDWLKVEESAGGCRMLWQYPNGAKARVGDVVHLENQPAVGVIRWLKEVANYGLLAGVQLLAPGAKAVMLCGTTPDAMRFPALLLPAMKNLGQPSTLVVSPSIKQGSRLLMKIHHGGKTIETTQTLQSTGMVNQVQWVRRLSASRPPSADSALTLSL